PLDYLSSRIPATPPYMAYLKVSEGCDNKCTFCMIPKIRGRLRSYPLKDLVEEVRRLCGERDLKEIILIAQDLTQYGKDLGIESGLIRLLEELLRLNGPPWIRLMYLNPWGIEKGLISLIESEERLCPYLDLPIQHIDDSVLTLMGRGGAKRVLEVLDLLRSTTRRVAIRTTLMVGFPTERDSSFKKLCDLVKRYRFDHLGAFIYSPEKGTKAARFTPRVRRDTAQRRYLKLMDLQREVSRISNESLLGCEVEVLVEGAHPESEDLLVGRTPFMAPEIDGSVLINRGFARAGEFKRVKITEAYDYDLVGEIVG
ncbi:MAG: MiaB/RimO family radical SAM methylthiotransferase, partial [Desulfatiglandales bacterium]